MKNALKKALCAVFAAMLAISAMSLTACGKQNNLATADDYMGKPFNNDFDMAVVVNGATYHVRTDSASVLDQLGNEYEYYEVVSCVYNGYDKEFEYEGISVCTVPVDGKDIIEQFKITGGDYSTVRGIKIGSTRDEVIAAYGDAFYDDGWYMTYSESNDPNNIRDMRIQIHLVDGVVTELFIYSPSY